MRECISSRHRSQFTDNTMRTPDHSSLRQGALPPVMRVCIFALRAERRHDQPGSTQHGEIARPPHPRGAGHDAWHNLCTLSTAVTH